ncbi:MerC domain-containing protein [Jiulongibacter sp. NS-SX5]|uniref:MerC domain-containing protein n=1 Tax=Jiulongibacter sp. NS-SX5 TaxID=3463854 RepID=UPI004059010B
MKSKSLDILGISAATLCLLHCLLFPFLFIVPMRVSHNPFVDLVFLLIGIFSVYRLTKNMEFGLIKALFWIGISIILISIVLQILLFIHTPLIYIGATTLIITHVVHYANHSHGNQANPL